MPESEALEEVPESEALEEGDGKRCFGRCRNARLWRKVPESEALEKVPESDTLDEGAGKRGFGRSAGKMKEMPESEAWTVEERPVPRNAKSTQGDVNFCVRITRHFAPFTGRNQQGTGKRSLEKGTGKRRYGGMSRKARLWRKVPENEAL